MRRAFTVLLAVAGMLALATTGARAAPSGRRSLVVGLPMAEARLLIEREPAFVGLGVYPPSRGSEAFLRELGAALEGTQPPAAAILPSAADLPAADLPRAFDPTPASSVEGLLDESFAVVAAATADDAEAVIRPRAWEVTILGISERGPVLVGLRRGIGRGLLEGATVRRTGILTPEDLARALGDAATDEPPTLSLQPDPLARLDELGARLDRDALFGPGLSKATAGAGIGAVVFGSLALLARKRRLAAAFARAAAMVPAGYIGALFVPDGRWQARALVVAGAFALGFVLLFPNTRRTCGWMILLTSFGVAALAIVAAARPDAEPALSLWGNPLNSWRFFGLRNHLVGFVSGGLVAGATLLGASAWVLLLGAAGLGVVVGAPAVGANFVGVLTLAFGATIAVLGRIAGRVRIVHLVAAAITAAGAMAAALLADAGSPVSHGGRAVESVRSGGFDAAWQILRRRAALNRAEVEDIGLTAVVGFALAALVIGLLFTWAIRSTGAPAALRAGIAGSAAAALAALVIEDSGFLAGSQMGLFPWIAFAAWSIDELRARSARSEHPPSRAAPSGG